MWSSSRSMRCSSSSPVRSRSRSGSVVRWSMVPPVRSGVSRVFPSSGPFNPARFGGAGRGWVAGRAAVASRAPYGGGTPPDAAGGALSILAGMAEPIAGGRQELLTGPGEVRIRRALLSVSDKRGIVDFARGLAELGVELVSTGGTARELGGAGLDVRGIEDFTGFPEIMDGRVKTLHPKLYAGLLARRDEPGHLREAAENGVEFVDLVCANLYPFERTAARRGVSDAEVIEDIDIGGPSMIRAAAKNHAFTAVVVTPESYDAVLE